MPDIRLLYMNVSGLIATARKEGKEPDVKSSFFSPRYLYYSLTAKIKRERIRLLSRDW